MSRKIFYYIIMSILALGTAGGVAYAVMNKTWYGALAAGVCLFLFGEIGLGHIKRLNKKLLLSKDYGDGASCFSVEVKKDDDSWERCTLVLCEGNMVYDNGGKTVEQLYTDIAAAEVPNKVVMTVTPVFGDGAVKVRFRNKNEAAKALTAVKARMSAAKEAASEIVPDETEQLVDTEDKAPAAETN